MRKDPRKQGLEERRLVEAKRAAGLRFMRGVSSGNRVRACAACRCMVVDSEQGWKAHYARMPQCKEG